VNVAQIDKSKLAERYRATIETFIAEIAAETGPRPAGSETEARAAQTIADRLTPFCHEVRIDRFTARPGENRAASSALIWLLFASGIALYFYPLAGLPLYFVALAIVLLDRGFKINLFAFIYPSAEITNVIARKKCKGERKKLILLAAHHDSGRQSTVASPNLRRFYKPLKNGVPWVLLIMLLSGIGATMMAGAARLGMILIFLLGWEWLFFLDKLVEPRKPIVGANDNLSGVAVLIAAAEELAAVEYENTEIRFVSFGGEEVGALGSKNFIEKYRADLADTKVLVLDSVARGEVLAAVKSEVEKSAHHSGEVIDLLKRAGQIAEVEVGTAVLETGGSDAASFTAQKLAAGLLTAKPIEEFSISSWHESNDLPENLAVDLVLAALAVTLGFIALIEEESQ
jgi:Peptidase family M28